jgi:AmmeMemoRadiSam system protein B
MATRRAAVAGSWYSAEPADLREEVEHYLTQAGDSPTEARDGLIALVAPHAGLMYSGPVAAHAYRHLAASPAEVIVLVGPSHFVAFDGVSIWPDGSFETPFGPLPVDAGVASKLLERDHLVRPLTAAHVREHSLEMQLPFLALLKPRASIVPLVMGHQTRATAMALADALAACLHGSPALMIASSDLSHYFDASIAKALDEQVLKDIEAFDPERLMTRLERRPDHACGGGAIVSVLQAARQLGATTSRVLRYGDSGDISGDKAAVVGYAAAGVWH